MSFEDSVFNYLKTEIDSHSGVARIELDRADRRNALNLALLEELKEALSLAGADDRVRVIAIGGQGPDFCAGADLAEVEASAQQGAMASLAAAEAFGELFLLLRRLEKPVVAVVHGRALAGGCGLATACDLVLACESAEFGYPEVKLGFVPAMVAAIIRRNLGEKRAFELMTMADSIGAGEAAGLGLVNRVYSDDTFAHETGEFLTTLSRRSASAIGLTKRLLYQTETQSFEAAIQTGAEVNALARMTEDCRAGIRAFMEK